MSNHKSSINRQNQFYRIINYCPRPGVFSLLEILIFVVGIVVMAFLFRFISGSQIQDPRDLIRSTAFVPSVSVGFLLFIISWMMQRNRKIQQGQLKQIETKMEQYAQLNAALNTEQNKIATLLANWPDPIFVMDVQTRIIDANPAAEHLMGVSKLEPLLGKNEVDLQPSELANEILEENQTILNTGKSLINKEVTRLNRTTGNWQQLLITKVALRDQHEQIIGLASIVRNITPQKQAEDALRSANQKLREGIIELEQRTQEMDLLTQMIDLLSACPTMDEAYRIIEDQLGKLNLADSGMLYTINSSRNNLQQVAAWGQNISEPAVFSPMDCWGLRRGQLHIVEFHCQIHQNIDHANPLICPHVSSTTPADYLCLPLVAQGETLGVLHLRHLISADSTEFSGTSKGWFTPQRIQRISIIAESLALAIANLELRSTLRQQSIRDPLTGLYNRRYLEETLERELLRASRSKKNVGLMMIDIDHFKQFNDTYGHLAADAVLAAIAHLFSSNIRGEDLVCRYGGEEILIMMPETDLRTTCLRAEAIREKVAQFNVQYKGQVLRRINISVGVAIFPDHGQTPEAIINSADQALYRAKNNGRNRVEVATPIG